MDEKKTRGVFAATLTPMKTDLSIDHEALARHCRWLLKNGCDGIVLFGTTGEANSLTVAERKEIIDMLLEGNPFAERLIVGTGCCAVGDTVDLTRHAQRYPVAGVLTLPPFYYKNVSDDGLFAAFDAVVQGVGAADLRIYLYHFPKMSGVPFSLNLIERFLKSYGNTFAGVKDSSGDFENMKAMIKAFPGFRVFAGTEAYLLDILRIGGAGCISATTNATGSLASEIFRRWESDDMSEAQARLTSVRKAFEAFPFIPGLKTMMARWTENDAWLNMRPPFLPLTREGSADLQERLNALHFRPNL